MYILCLLCPRSCEERLKAICPDVEFLAPDFWEPLCRKHWSELKDRFRLTGRNAGKLER